MRVFGRLIYFLIVLLAVAAHAIDARSGQPVDSERPIILGDIDRAVDPRARRSVRWATVLGCPDPLVASHSTVGRVTQTAGKRARSAK